MFQIKAGLLKENTFVSNLLKWLPLPLQHQKIDSEPEPEIKGELYIVEVLINILLYVLLDFKQHLLSYLLILCCLSNDNFLIKIHKLEDL